MSGGPKSGWYCQKHVGEIKMLNDEDYKKLTEDLHQEYLEGAERILRGTSYAFYKDGRDKSEEALAKLLEQASGCGGLYKEEIEALAAGVQECIDIREKNIKELVNSLSFYREVWIKHPKDFAIDLLKKDMGQCASSAFDMCEIVNDV